MRQSGFGPTRLGVCHSTTRKSMLCLVWFAVALAVLLLAVSQARAEGTGRIHGTARDSNGHGVGGIAVSAWQLVDGKWKSAPGVEWTNADGTYDWSLLSPGTYRVEFMDVTGALHERRGIRAFLMLTWPALCRS